MVQSSSGSLEIAIKNIFLLNSVFNVKISDGISIKIKNFYRFLPISWK